MKSREGGLGQIIRIAINIIDSKTILVFPKMFDSR